MKTTKFLFFICVQLISFQVIAQDMIFKKNGEIVKVRILNNIGSSLSYRHFEQKDSITYYISAASIDSILYQNGHKDVYARINPSLQSPVQNANPVYRHNLIGFDLASILLYNSLNISYEYLPGKANLGFKASFATKISNVNSNYVNTLTDYSLNSVTNWNFKIGMDYYFYPPGSFRFGTGLQYVFGLFNDQSYNSNTNTYDNSTKNIQGLLLSGFGFYNIMNNLAVNLGLDIPLFMNPSSSISWLQCEIMYNF